MSLFQIKGVTAPLFLRWMHGVMELSLLTLSPMILSLDLGGTSFSFFSFFFLFFLLLQHQQHHKCAAFFFFFFFLHTCLCVNTNIIKNSLVRPFLCKFVDLRQTVDLSVYFIDTFCCWLLCVLCLFICFVVFCLFVCCHKFLLLSVFPSSFLQIYVYISANESQWFVQRSKSNGVRVAGSQLTPCTPPWWSWRPRTSCCQRRTRTECGCCLSTWQPTAQTATLRRLSAS